MIEKPIKKLLTPKHIYCHDNLSSLERDVSLLLKLIINNRKKINEIVSRLNGELK